MLTLLLHLIISLGLFFHYTFVKPPDLLERQKTQKRLDFLTPKAVLNRAIAKGDAATASTLRNRYGRLTALGSFGMQQWGGSLPEGLTLEGGAAPGAAAGVQYNRADSAGPFGDPDYNKNSFGRMSTLREVSRESSGGSGGPAYADYLDTSRSSHHVLPAGGEDVVITGAGDVAPGGAPRQGGTARLSSGAWTRGDQAKGHRSNSLPAAAGAAAGKDAGAVSSSTEAGAPHEESEKLSCGQKTYRVLLQAPWRWIKGRKAWLKEAVLEDENFRWVCSCIIKQYRK
jgi:hypothetical protein